MNYSVNSKCRLYLKDLKKLCRSYNIKLICYISPTFNQPKILKSQKEKLYSFFSDNNISLLDYSNEYYSKNAFKLVWNWSDAFHLNANGAKIFTRVIRKDINEL
jgi:intein-encoded DNA endonuclease-like protein